MSACIPQKFDPSLMRLPCPAGIHGARHPGEAYHEQLGLTNALQSVVSNLKQRQENLAVPRVSD